MAPSDFKDLADDVIKHATSVLGHKDVKYLFKSGGEIQIKAVFDDRVEQVDPDTEVLVTSNVFTLGVRLADLPKKPSKGDRVFIDGVYYKVTDSQDDGVPGVSVVLYLHKV